jgi:N-ethylmaleimide reductase
MVMSPMTRSRATPEHVPTALMAEYYGQRAAAGMIFTEGTAPSPNGAGYPRIPGLWSAEQVAAWKPVTEAVHKKGSIFIAQLMHTGRVGHPLNLPKGAEIVSASAVAAEGEMYTDQKANQPYPVPRALETAEIAKVRDEYVNAAKNAIAAGFDGVELHGANGYLIEQFLSPHTNTRTDAYGGSVANRIRFAVEVADAVAKAIGGQKVGMHLSPYGVNAGMKPYPEIDETYLALTKALIPTGIQCLWVVDHSAMGAPPVPASIKQGIRAAWPRTFILGGGFDAESANRALESKAADLIGFGRSFLANPDFVVRAQKGLPLNAPDFGTFYSPGPKGYTDYPSAT